MNNLNIKMVDCVLLNVEYDSWSRRGCETCDYGSYYHDEFILHFDLGKIKIYCGQMYDYPLSEAFMMKYLLMNIEELKQLDFKGAFYRIKWDMANIDVNEFDGLWCCDSDIEVELITDEEQGVGYMNEIAVFKMNDCDYVASHLSVEETNEWYIKNYDDNDLEDIEEMNLDEDYMWYILKDEEEYNLAHCDKYRQVGCEVFEYVTFKEALRRDGEYTEPYIIASSEY